MTKGILEIPFRFPGQTMFYKGKVRDVFTIMNTYLAMVVSDRISAFDVVLPKPIPYKGQVLNQIAYYALEATRDIVPNWAMFCPHPMVTVGIKCEAFPVEMVIRDLFMGSLERDYRDTEGKLNDEGEIRGPAWVQARYGLSDEIMEEMKTMKINQRFSKPIITPTTKAVTGHDQPISPEAIIAQGLVSPEDYAMLEDLTRKLFERGKEMAAKQGLMLLDTKYEFGKKDGKIYLIDEIHTPDSSRYCYITDYDNTMQTGCALKQLSKEFVREWLMARGFKGKPGQVVPEMSDEFVQEVSEKYIELYEVMTGKKFVKVPYDAQSIQYTVEKLFTFPIAIITGSSNDWKKMKPVADYLKEQKMRFSLHAESAHRTPEEIDELITLWNRNGVRIVIAGAGLSAALAGAIASKFNGIVIGVPLKGAYDGLDAFLSVMDMPPGIPLIGVGVEDMPVAARLAELIMRKKFIGVHLIGNAMESTTKMLKKFDLDFVSFGTAINPEEINIKFVDMTDPEPRFDAVSDTLIIYCPLYPETDAEDALELMGTIGQGVDGGWVGPNRGDNAALAALKILSLNNEELKTSLIGYRKDQGTQVLEKELELRVNEWSSEYAFINEDALVA